MTKPSPLPKRSYLGTVLPGFWLRSMLAGRWTAALWMALVLSLALPAGARRPPSVVLQNLAAQPAKVLETLKRTHAQVNAALANRAARLKSYRAAFARRERAAARLATLQAEGRTDLVLQRALREALVLDEEAQRSRASLLASEAEVARLGARLLEVFDLAIAQRGRQIRGRNAGDARQSRTIAQYRALTRQRVTVRQLLQPVLTGNRKARGTSLQEVRAAPHDDVETLLEKADLARDLEERFLQRAAQVHRRIRELEQERSLARDTVGMIREQDFFGERDYRPIFGNGAAGSGPAMPGFGGGLAALARGGASPQAAGSPPSDTDVEVSPGPPQANGDTATLDSPEAMDPTPPPESPGFNNGTDSDDRAGAVTQDEIDPNTGAAPIGGAGNAVATRGSGTTPALELSTLPAEQVYLGAGIASDTRLRELIVGGELSLRQLLKLERKLLREARSMRKENKRIKTRLRRDLKRSR